MGHPFRLTIAALLTATAATAQAPPEPRSLDDLRHAEVGGIGGGGEPRRIELDVTGLERLTLVATGHSWGQAVWGEAELAAADGTRVRLSGLRPESATVGWGAFTPDRGPDGKPLKAGSREFAHGLFAHADSEVVYALDRKYVRFEAWVGVNHTAGREGRVTFRAADGRLSEFRRRLDDLRRLVAPESTAGLRRAIERALAGKPANPEALRKDLDRLSASETAIEGIRRRLDGSELAVLADAEPVRRRLDEARRGVLAGLLDAPLLFVKRHPYRSGHIYDEYLTWHPGGGIYVLENPAAPVEEQVVRPVVDPATKETPGAGVYSDPDLSNDGKRVLFAFKGKADGDTSIWEIGIDGTGLRRLTDPGRDMSRASPAPGLIGAGHHDVKPSYLPDGRIVFTSTRTVSHVMCFSSYIDTLHTMNPDGSGIRCISVNNLNEFDPAVLPDGRILYGRWEYVDKTALYMQSLWTANPDGTQERALFANNLAKPTALLDARPVPGTNLVAASLTPHNGQSVGAIAMIDPAKGKNNLAAITNFTPEYPTEMDQGLMRGPCDPWPISADFVLFANNAEHHGPHGVLELASRDGWRTVIRREPDISCYSPILVRPRPRPPVLAPRAHPGEPGRFLVRDVYRGLEGVRRGEVKSLRVIETTARVSGIPPGGRWWNQAFLASWQGSYDIKNFLGVVPVAEDGSAFFEAPAGKALYVQALDADGRLVQSMRTFVQAAPGVTRSCAGCHVADEDVAPANAEPPSALGGPPARIAPEAWGSGFLDYPARVQPVLDAHCVRCHGGAEGIAAGLDFSGGWTWAFNIGYETLIQNTLVGFLNCENGSVRTSEILPPRTHGSGAAPLSRLIADGHGGKVKDLTPGEINLLHAWMDGNGNYYGTWNYTENAVCDAVLKARDALLPEMEKAGCLKCHDREIGYDWINLKDPERSRILRAPLAERAGGAGLGWCRDRRAPPVDRPLVKNGDQPPDVFRPHRRSPPDPAGIPAPTFPDDAHPTYRAMRDILRAGREAALKAPRVDMPGADIVEGKCRGPVCEPEAARKPVQ